MKSIQFSFISLQTEKYFCETGIPEAFDLIAAFETFAPDAHERM